MLKSLKLNSLASLVFLISIWELLGRQAYFDTRLVPMPSNIFDALIEMIKSGELLNDIYWSSSRAIIGYLIGALIGILIGLMTSLNKTVGQLLVPIIQLIRPIPPISFVPLVVLWFGINESSKYLLVFLGVFFPVWISTYIGVQEVDKRYIWIAKSLGISKSRLILNVILPASLPVIISGLRTSIAIAFFCLVAAEMAGAYYGIVFRVNLAHSAFRIDKMLACLIVLGMLSSLADGLFTHLTKKMIRWSK